MAQTSQLSSPPLTSLIKPAYIEQISPPIAMVTGHRGTQVIKSDGKCYEGIVLVSTRV